MELNKEFLKFLEDTPEALKKFLEIAAEWRKLQLTPPGSVAPAEGPRSWQFGKEHELRTKGISLEDIEAIEKGYAEATVKEKAMEYVKGFVTGVMLAT